MWAIEYSKIQQGLIWAGTNDGKLWYTKDGGANWIDVTKNFKDLPPWGTFTQIWPSTFDPGHGLRRRVVPPDGRPQAVHLQDHGLRRDVDEDHRQHPDRPSARLRAVARRATRTRRACSSPAPAARSTTRWTTATTWTQFKDGLPPAPVSWITVEPRFHDVVVSTYGRGLFILPNITLLEQTGQHGAAADRRTQAYSSRRRSSGRRAACSRRPAVRTSRSRSPPRRPAPIKMEILDAGGKADQDADRSSAHQGWNGAELGSALRRADARRAEDDAAGKPAHLGGAAVPGHGHPPRSRTGASRRRPASRWRRPASTRCASRSTAQRYTQPFEVMKDPGDRDVGRGPARRRRRRRCGFATTSPTTSDDGQPDGDLAEADRGSGEGERGEGGRSSRR